MSNEQGDFPTSAGGDQRGLPRGQRAQLRDQYAAGWPVPLLGLHHVNETVPQHQWIYWHMGFLVWGAVMIICGC